MGSTNLRAERPHDKSATDRVCDKLDAIHREHVETNCKLSAILTLIDHFFGVFINARFPHGKPFDRWGRR